MAERGTAVFRPEKEKSRPLIFGWGRGCFSGSPARIFRGEARVEFRGRVGPLKLGFSE